jgi:hypothetical protein
VTAGVSQEDAKVVTTAVVSWNNDLTQIEAAASRGEDTSTRMFPFYSNFQSRCLDLTIEERRVVKAAHPELWGPADYIPMN